METFISQYPEIAISLLGALVGVISVLLAALLWFFRKAIADLAVAIRELREELKSSIDQDRHIIGTLLDRMQAVEVRCEETRKRCPAMIIEKK